MKLLLIVAIVFVAGIELAWSGNTAQASASGDAAVNAAASSDGNGGNSASADADASTNASGGGSANANGGSSATAGDASASASSSSSSSSDPFNQMEGKCGCCPLPCCCVCNEITEPGTTPEPVSTTPFVPVCESSLCLALIVDISASIGDENLVLVKSFLSTLIQKVSGNQANSDSKTAIVAYATNATLMYDFSHTAATDADIAEQIVNSLQLGKFTNTVEGIELCITDVWNGRGVPEDCPKWTMIFSDGRSNYRVRERGPMGAALQAESSVLSVGVTNQVNKTELAMYNTGDEDDVILIENFTDLDDFLAPIIKTVCTEFEAPPPVVVETPVVVVVADECFCCCPPPYGPQGMLPRSAFCPNC